MVDQVLGSLINPASPLSTTSGFTTNNVVLTVGSTVSVGLWSPNTNTLALNTNSTQVITINSTGNVGIATSNPSATLHVVGPGTAVGSRGLIARFVDAGTRDSVTINGGIDGNTPATDGTLNLGGGAQLSYSLTSTHAVNLATAYSGLTSPGMLVQGYVGIGTTSASGRLTVRGDTGDNATIDIKNNATNIWKLWNDNGASALNFQYNGTTSMLLTNSSNLGIGTTNNITYDAIAAGRPLVAASASASTTVGGSTAAITITNTDLTAENYAQINFAGLTPANANHFSSAIIAASVGPRVSGQYPTGNLIFMTSTLTNNAPSEKMRITSAGNIYFSTAGAQIGSAKVSIQSGTTNATQYTTLANNGGSTMYINQQQTTSVSTVATTILATPFYATLALVHGSDGANRFSDLVLMSVGTGTVNVISSLTASGIPAVRTYSQSSSTFKLAMASGTYTVQVSSICMNS